MLIFTGVILIIGIVITYEIKLNKEKRVSDHYRNEVIIMQDNYNELVDDYNTLYELKYPNNK